MLFVLSGPLSISDTRMGLSLFVVVGRSGCLICSALLRYIPVAVHAKHADTVHGMHAASVREHPCWGITHNPHLVGSSLIVCLPKKGAFTAGGGRATRGGCIIFPS